MGVTIALAIGHFIVPFLFLLPCETKRRRSTLLAASLWILAMHYLDIYWQILPALHADGPHPHRLDALMLIGTAVVFSAAIAGLMRVIAPVVSLSNLTAEQKDLMLEANFHSAPDARYATSEGVVYAAFIHPLSAPQESEVRSGTQQVAAAARGHGIERKDLHESRARRCGRRRVRRFDLLYRADFGGLFGPDLLRRAGEVRAAATALCGDHPGTPRYSVPFRLPKTAGRDLREGTYRRANIDYVSPFQTSYVIPLRPAR